MDFDKYFVKSELIPAVIQEKSTGEVLMLAYMNRESMQKTFETGYTWFWSRSRQELWNKGATSGHLQKVVDIFADCDDEKKSFPRSCFRVNVFFVLSRTNRSYSLT